MSQPRRIDPGATYLITRRVLRRHHLLRPDAATTQFILYSLAISADRYGIRVHAVCVMSTHMHLVVTDPRGVLPKFLQYFHRLVALGIKAIRRWEGSVWDSRQVSVVQLMTSAAIAEKIAYVHANPVAAGLVQRAHEWPGVNLCVGEPGSDILQVRRPDIYFNTKKTPWPVEACLHITLPPSIDPEHAAGFHREIADELERQEAMAHAEMRQQGRRFLGAEKATRVSPEARATSLEPLRGRNPTFAVGRGQGAAWRAAAAAVRTFRASYRAALERWRADERKVAFPMGTWWMRIFHGAAMNDVAMAA